MAHNELNEEYDKKRKEVKLMTEEISRLKKDIMSITTERNKFQMHKELLSKDFTPGKNVFMKMISKNNSSKNFNDVVKILKVKNSSKSNSNSGGSTLL